AIAPKPGRSLKKNAFLPFAGREMLAFPILVPVLSRTTIETDVEAELRLTTATPVLKAVSSQIRVLVVADVPDIGTTASWSAIPGMLSRKTPYPTTPPGKDAET